MGVCHSFTDDSAQIPPGQNSTNARNFYPRLPHVSEREAVFSPTTTRHLLPLANNGGVKNIWSINMMVEQQQEIIRAHKHKFGKMEEQ